jgi:hypothetical protein
VRAPDPNIAPITMAAVVCAQPRPAALAPVRPRAHARSLGVSRRLPAPSTPPTTPLNSPPQAARPAARSAVKVHAAAVSGGRAVAAWRRFCAA